ncbi:MAG: hypothetical protein C0518_05145 [Opitutus sp.]|nr:hypothetical protein [Opitutus sp.]
MVATSGARASIRVVGSDLLGERFRIAVGKFAHENGLAVSLELRGTRPGLEELAGGAAAVGLFTLPPGEPPPGEPFASRVVAFQAVAIVVPSASPLTQMTMAQARAVFAQGAGESFSTWGDLGFSGDWRARPLAAHALAPEAGLTLPLARRLLLHGADLKTVVRLAADVEHLAQRLRAAENTLGLTSAVPSETSGLRAISLAESLTVPAYAPTAENLASGHYALRLPLYVTVRRVSAPHLLPFLKFLLSEECAEALAGSQFLALPASARNALIFEFEELR